MDKVAGMHIVKQCAASGKSSSSGFRSAIYSRLILTSPWVTLGLSFPKEAVLGSFRLPFPGQTFKFVLLHSPNLEPRCFFAGGQVGSCLWGPGQQSTSRLPTLEGKGSGHLALGSQDLKQVQLILYSSLKLLAVPQQLSHFTTCLNWGQSVVLSSLPDTPEDRQ